jgi:hypothetical protein
MTNFQIEFGSHNRKPKVAPNPAYPNGIDVDLAKDAKVACFSPLPYPAECCGIWFVVCKTCGSNATITAAGRVDDPRSVKLACKVANKGQPEMKGNA